MIKIVSVLGARPQFIKASVVSRAISVHPGLSETIIHTGQHFDAEMSDVFFSQLDMTEPAYNLGVSGDSHGVMTGRMLQALDPILEHLLPDVVLVYGDTNSTLAGALSAGKMHIPVAHIEAGLRSHNRMMPEEQNRVLTDHLADVLFTPTTVATNNLIGEGISKDSIHQVGDVMYDAALFFAQKAQEERDVMGMYGLQPKSYILVTIHRAENTDDKVRLTAIMEGLEIVANQIPVVLPLHPRTKSALEYSGINLNKVMVIKPVGYLEMTALEMNATLVVTDSGGVQKEAFFHQTPCVTLRDETEWVELVDAGWNKLVPPVTGSNHIAEEIISGLTMSGALIEPYGGGDASTRIVEIISKI